MTREEREEFLSKVDIYDLAKLVVEYNELHNDGEFDYLEFDSMLRKRDEIQMLMSATELSEYCNWKD